jgi:hypothetical protein
MKSVLLYINDDPGLEARLQAALDLTRSLKGHLHCLRASPDHPQTAFAGMAGTSVTSAIMCKSSIRSYALSLKNV